MNVPFPYHDAGVCSVVVRRVHAVEALLPGRIPKICVPWSNERVGKGCKGMEKGGGIISGWIRRLRLHARVEVSKVRQRE